MRQLLAARRTQTLCNRTYTGLMAIMFGVLVDNKNYAIQSMIEPKQIQTIDNKEKLKLELIDSFERAAEYTKEAARLQQEASYYTYKALTLQKELLLKK